MSQDTFHPIVLNDDSIVKLIEKIKNMPDFDKVFGDHVEVCVKDNRDPFKGFTEKAVEYWNLYEYMADLYMSQEDIGVEEK
jgi:hypothetical protein